MSEPIVPPHAGQATAALCGGFAVPVAIFHEILKVTRKSQGTPLGNVIEASYLAGADVLRVALNITGVVAPEDPEGRAQAHHDAILTLLEAIALVKGGCRVGMIGGFAKTSRELHDENASGAIYSIIGNPAVVAMPALLTPTALATLRGKGPAIVRYPTDALINRAAFSALLPPEQRTQLVVLFVGAGPRAWGCADPTPSEDLIINLNITVSDPVSAARDAFARARTADAIGLAVTLAAPAEGPASEEAPPEIIRASLSIPDGTTLVLDFTSDAPAPWQPPVAPAPEVTQAEGQDGPEAAEGAEAPPATDAPPAPTMGEVGKDLVRHVLRSSQPVVMHCCDARTMAALRGLLGGAEPENLVDTQRLFSLVFQAISKTRERTRRILPEDPDNLTSHELHIRYALRGLRSTRRGARQPAEGQAAVEGDLDAAVEGVEDDEGQEELPWAPGRTKWAEAMIEAVEESNELVPLADRLQREIYLLRDTLPAPGLLANMRDLAGTVMGTPSGPGIELLCFPAAAPIRPSSPGGSPRAVSNAGTADGDSVSSQRRQRPPMMWTPPEAPPEASRFHDQSEERMVAEAAVVLQALPTRVSSLAFVQSNLLGIAEFVLDLGKPPRVRLQGRAEDAILDSEPLSHYDIAQTYEAVGADNWREDNRAAIDGSLHRMSCVRSARGNVTGITIKLCRAVRGSADALADAVRDGRSIIVLGGPHSGKTTALREFARYQAAMRRRTIVIDTHGDLGGDGDVAHSALGSARRVAVAKRWQQAELIAATLRDQTPETIVVDDVASAEDVYAVRLALARGVQVLAGCDCPTLQEAMQHLTLSALFLPWGAGGVELTAMPISEPGKATAPILMAAEIVSPALWRVHGDALAAVKASRNGDDSDWEARECMVRGGQVRVCYDAEAKRKVHEARDRAAMVRLAASSSTASSRRGSYSSRAQHRAAAKQASADAMAYTLSRMHVGHAMSQAMGAVTLPQIQGLLQSTAGFGGFQTAPHALAMGHPGSMPLSTAPYGADPSRMPYGAVPGVSMPLPPPGGPSPFPWGP